MFLSWGDFNPKGMRGHARRAWISLPGMRVPLAKYGCGYADDSRLFVSLVSLWGGGRDTECLLKSLGKERTYLE